MTTKPQTQVTTRVIEDNPLEGESLLRNAMFVAPPRPLAATTPRTSRPDHYRIVSISLYTEDIERLNRMVTQLKRRGHHKVNKSQLIRYALARLDLREIADAPVFFDGGLAQKTVHR